MRCYMQSLGFPGGSDGQESACSMGDLGSIPGLGKYPGEGNGNPLQSSCWENLMDRGALLATVHDTPKSQRFSPIFSSRRSVICI